MRVSHVNRDPYRIIYRIVQTALALKWQSKVSIISMLTWIEGSVNFESAVCCTATIMFPFLSNFTFTIMVMRF